MTEYLTAFALEITMFVLVNVIHDPTVVPKDALNMTPPPPPVTDALRDSVPAVVLEYVTAEIIA